MDFFKRYRGRLICTGLGLAAAISFLTLGFVKTIVILLCCGAGYAIGTLKDKGISIPGPLRFWRRKW